MLHGIVFIAYFGCEKHVILHLYIFPFFNGADYYYLNFRVMKFQDLRLFDKTNMFSMYSCTYPSSKYVYLYNNILTRWILYNNMNVLSVRERKNERKKSEFTKFLVENIAKT